MHLNICWLLIPLRIRKGMSHPANPHQEVIKDKSRGAVEPEGCATCRHPIFVLLHVVCAKLQHSKLCIPFSSANFGIVDVRCESHGGVGEGFVGAVDCSQMQCLQDDVHARDHECTDM
jgi:hypothetical protein